MAPKSPHHLQFAYYESSLVVQFLRERFGREKLLIILKDLGQGTDINDTLAKHTLPMNELEREFEAYAHKIANDMAPGLDWEKPSSEKIAVAPRGRRPAAPDAGTNATAELPEGAWELWAKLRPTNYWVMLRQAERFATEKKWAEAKPVLQKLVELYPDATGPASPYRTLALTHRELGETNSERQMLMILAAKDDEAQDAYARLMELATETEDWPTVLTNAQRYLAVNPLVPLPYRFLARGSEASNDLPAAIEAYRALLQLDPPNPADLQFRLAKLLHQEGSPEARRHLLEALEEAPRFREALRLWRQMREDDARKTSRMERTFQ